MTVLHLLDQLGEWLERRHRRATRKANAKARARRLRELGHPATTTRRLP